MNTFYQMVRLEQRQKLEEGVLKNTLAALGVAGSLLTSPVKGAAPTPPTLTQESQQGVNLAYHFIKGQENSKQNKKGGWSAQHQKWFPHKSLEGGLPTIGYGHKLKSTKELDRFNQGITDTEAEQLLYADIKAAYTSLAQKMAKKKMQIPTNMYALAMLLDIEFNVRGGIDSYPLFLAALNSNNIQGMVDNYRRYAQVKGERVEINRSKMFKTALLDPYIKTLPRP